jgi:hypothetical protein
MHLASSSQPSRLRGFAARIMSERPHDPPGARRLCHQAERLT